MSMAAWALGPDGNYVYAVKGERLVATEKHLKLSNGASRAIYKAS